MNMIEKVAKIIYEFDEGMGSWDNASFSSQMTNRALAKLAIAAMREPTPLMVAVGNKDTCLADFIWINMIDAALKE